MIRQEQPQRSLRRKSRLLPWVVLLLAGLQLFFPFKGWIILLAGFGGLWLLSYLWARSLLKGLEIERDLRFGWKQVGDRLRERIVLRNSGWAPSMWVEVDDHSDMNEYDISSVSDVRGFRHRSWHTQGFCDTRGLYTIGPVTLRAQDPFGVYEVAVDYTSSANMMVAPPVISLPEIEIASGGRVGEGRSSNKGLERTISTVGVREYVAGDSLRFLHWPTIARTGDMYVHLFDSEPSSDWWVLLDMDPETQVGEGARSTVEHGVILAASLVNRGIQRGKQVGLVSYGDDLVWHPPSIGNAHLYEILRSLAAIHPGGPPLDQILLRLRSSLDQNASLAIITANLTPDWIDALELLKRVGIIPTVLILEPVSFGGQGDLEAFCQRLRKLEIAHYTITADLLDQPKKRPQGLRWLIEQTRLRGNQVNKWTARWQALGRLVRTWGLIMVLLYLMGTMLGSSIRGLETDFVFFVIGGGVLLGWLLARSRLAGWLAAALNILIGWSITILWVGHLGPALLRVLTAAYDVLAQLYAYVFQDAEAQDAVTVDLSQLGLEITETWENLKGLLLRLWDWFLALLSGEPFYDPVATTVLWGLGIWSVVTWAMWSVFRKRNPFLAFLPAISLVTISLALGGQTSYSLAFMFGAAIALMAYINHDTHESHWVRGRLTYTETIRRRITTIVGLLSVALVLFSLLSPSISLRSLAEFARKATGSDQTSPVLAHSLGIEAQASSQEADILDLKGEGGLPNEHLVRSNDKLSEKVVLVVQVDTSQSAIPEAQLAQALSPLYLRSLVYDRYIGSGWASRDTEIIQYAPGVVIPSVESNARQVRQQVQFVEEPDGLMVTVGTLLSADQDFKVAWRLLGDPAGAYDVFGATIEGDAYRADSLVQVYSIDELRAAGQNYPEWMLGRYIGLPQSVPENVLTLARDLTATQTNPYDRAVAIESYLRQFPYSLRVSTGPAGVDIVEYFLFDIQKGYCDYYASAMVVLARAAGMPARYVSGYIGEYYDESLDAYVVTADQAHAWAEIYFPGYGWIQFEPTGGRQGIERPVESVPELPKDFELDFNPLVAQERFTFQDGLFIFWAVLLLMVFVLFVSWIISDWWISRMTETQQLPRLYRRLVRYGRWMRLPVSPGMTPFEFTDMLCLHLEQLAAGSHWDLWILAAEPIIRQISSAYVRVTFNPSGGSKSFPLDRFSPYGLMADYKKLRLRLWLLWFLGFVYKYWMLRPFFWTDAPLFISTFLEEES